MAKPRFEVAVGLFVVLGFLILSMIVFFVSGVYFFRPGYHLKAQFDYVGIIDRGAPVRFSGVRVGEVTKVDILEPGEERKTAKIEVTFFVERHVVVKDNYEVSVRGNHVMSEPHVSITPMPGEGRVLKDGDVVKEGISPFAMDDMFQEGQVILERMGKLLEDIGTAFEDPETKAMLSDSLKNMNNLLKSLNEIVVGEEEEYRAMIVNFNRVADEMAEMLERLNRAEGTIGKLITEDEVYLDLRDFVKEIKTHPWRLLKKD